MQIILLEKVINVGNLGDVVRVKDGFARNYLIPKKMARRATASALAEFEARRAEMEKLAADRLAKAQAAAEKLAGLTVTLVQKAGVDGRLFGSVTSGDVAEALVKQGFDVAKSQIRFPAGHVKTTGEHPVSIALHSDVVSEIKLQVQAEAI